MYFKNTDNFVVESGRSASRLDFLEDDLKSWMSNLSTKSKLLSPYKWVENSIHSPTASKGIHKTS